MNIALILSYLSDRFGGPVTVAKNLGPRLRREGHRVSYWAPGGVEDRRELEHLHGCHLYDFNWPRRWHRSKGLVRGLVESVPSIDLMQISGFWLHPTYATSRLAWASHVPYILRPAGAFGPWSLRRRRLKWFKKAVYLNFIAKSTMAHAACLQACSTNEAQNFRQAGYNGPVTIVPNGVDTNEYAPGDSTEAEVYWPQLKGRPVVAFMSRLSAEKGLDMFIPLWAELVRSGAHRDAILVLAGPDDRGYQKTVEAMVERHGIGSHVMMPGMIQGQKKLALLRRADIFILPSYSENFGIVVAEALACGTPVITTTGTPWQELQDVDAGRWVLPSPPELAQALRELLDMSQSHREAMGQRGRMLMEQNYTWDAVIQKFETVCHCVLNGNSIPLHPEPVRSEMK
jgi:glycosyltransferase involved in cell wall biosynthesis